MDTMTVDMNGREVLFGFLNTLQYKEIGMKNGLPVIRLTAPLYYVDGKGRLHTIQEGFESDKASIPRVPLLYWLLGEKFNREGVLHDAAYCKDYPIPLTRSEADELLSEASKSESHVHKGKPCYASGAVWLGVRIGGWPHYHKRSMKDHLELDEAYEQ